MKKKLTLWILLFPALIYAQVDIKNGSLIIDWGKKRPKNDSVQQQPQQERLPESGGDYGDEPAKKKEKAAKAEKQDQPQKPDYRKDGLFKALFHVGLNGCQIDGDGYAGYNYLGAEGGVGAMVRVHKFLSVSMCINYSMQGAKQRLVVTDAPQSLFQYRVEWDYLQIPVSLDIWAQRHLTFSIGLAPSIMVRYNERTEDGQDDTNSPPDGPPNRFDLQAFADLRAVIADRFSIGLKFQYSTFQVRGPKAYGVSRQNGEFNNVLTVDFMYIMRTVKKAK